MPHWSRFLIAATAAGVAGLFFLAAADADTFPLQLKRLEPIDPSAGTPPADAAYRMAQPQHFFMQVGFRQQPSGGAGNFSAVIRKEPDKYRSEYPLRGVAKLGDQLFGFALDCKDRESQEYCRLHFDLNHNGDLTDDRVVEGTPSEAQLPDNRWWYQFPRVDLTIEVGGQKADYSFFFTAQSASIGSGGFFAVEVEAAEPLSQESSGEKKTPVRYVSASLQSAAYREGEVKLDGRARRVVLLDFNSNGRFDDRVKMRRTSSGRAAPEYGDLLLLDPDPNRLDSAFDYYGLLGSQLAKLVLVDAALYDLEVTPAGDELTLTPSSAPLGHVTLPSDGFDGVFYSDLGLMKVAGDKSDAVPLPAGDWSLLYYNIDLTGRSEQARATEGEDEGPSLLEALAAALLESADAARPRTTRLSAYSAEGCEVVRVRKGETVAMPFGPPYKPVVTASSALRGGQTARLGLSLIGAGGERCSSLSVNGTRPEKPRFTITTPEGEEVQKGNFEYG